MGKGLKICMLGNGDCGNLGKRGGQVLRERADCFLIKGKRRRFREKKQRNVNGFKRFSIFFFS